MGEKLGFALRLAKENKAEVNERRKMKMKIGAIFLVSVMALAAIGGGYAAWFDTITVEGTVNTGSVGWDVVDYSGTWVWKNMANDQCEITHEGEIVQDTCILVASAYAKQTVDDAGAEVDDSVTVVFDNLFPCIDFEADFTVHYTGSVPGKINSITFRDLWPDTDDELLIDKFTTLEVEIGILDEATQEYVWTPLPVEDLDGYQLHYCNKIHVVMTIHLPQYYDLDGDGVEEPTDYLMNLDGSFDLDVEVVQWNEYGMVD